MKAIVVTDRAAEAAGITLAERPEPTPAIGDVVVEVRASGFVPREWEWPSTWVDRSGRDRAQAIIGHELAGVVTSLGHGTTGLSLGQRVLGITDWHRDGPLAEYAAVEARNLAPLPGNVDFTTGASLPISGLTAWQGLFQHGRLRAGQTVLAHGAAGAVGSAVTQLAREAGAYVIGTGRAADRQAALDFGANEFFSLDDEDLQDIGGVDLVFDVIGGDIQRRSAAIIRPGGTLVSVGGPAQARPADGLAVDFVVEPVPSQLAQITDRVRDAEFALPVDTGLLDVDSIELDALVSYDEVQVPIRRYLYQDGSGTITENAQATIVSGESRATIGFHMTPDGSTLGLTVDPAGEAPPRGMDLSFDLRSPCDLDGHPHRK